MEKVKEFELKLKTSWQALFGGLSWVKDRTGIKIADQNPLTGMTSEGQLA